MEMDCKLENNLAIFFKFFLCIVETLKTDYIVVLSRRNPLLFSPQCSNNNFMLEKKVLCQIFEQFGPKHSKIAVTLIEQRKGTKLKFAQ